MITAWKAVPHLSGFPKSGQTVRFTGTFLKMVRYAAGDGARLAPLVVGDQPPVPVREGRQGKWQPFIPTNDVGSRWTGSPASWLLGLTLALLAAGLLAWQHLHVPSRNEPGFATSARTTMASLTADPPLEFIEPHDELVTTAMQSNPVSNGIYDTFSRSRVRYDTASADSAWSLARPELQVNDNES